jgi:hypothetical protein
MDAGVFDSDLTACYDRLIPSQTAIFCHAAGVSIGQTNAKMKAHAKMKYKTKTAYIGEPDFSICTSFHQSDKKLFLREEAKMSIAPLRAIGVHRQRPAGLYST